MSVFGTIMSKIFRHPQAQAAPRTAPQAAPQAAQAAAPAPAQPTAAQQAPAVDVEAVLAVMAQDSRQTLDWRHSIVDLLKLLSIDSSLANRKTLAAELGYGGDTADSATMNIWLHKQVMRKLAENGGLVPDSLR
jgi:3-oxoacyl-ACP reductase-like protein